MCFISIVYRSMKYDLDILVEIALDTIVLKRIIR